MCTRKRIFEKALGFKHNISSLNTKFRVRTRNMDIVYRLSRKEWDIVQKQVYCVKNKSRMLRFLT